jgi:hypothetical protein
LPDELHREAKRVATEHEISLAEVVRRALEHLIRIYPPRPEGANGWQPPAPRPLGRFQAPVEEWRELANEGPPTPR